jgi:hypothetical protein
MSEYSDKCGNMSISLEILQKTRGCDKIIFMQHKLPTREKFIYASILSVILIVAFIN